MLDDGTQRLIAGLRSGDWIQKGSVEVSPEFDQWAAEAGYDVLRAAGQVIVASSNGGEIRYTSRIVDGTFLLGRSERAEDEIPVLQTTEESDVERYLTDQLGIDLRDARRLPRLRFPFEPAHTAPGFHFVTIADGWATLIRDSGEPISTKLVDSSMHPAVRFSYYADADVEDIRLSLSKAEATPLFASFVTG